MRLFIHKTLCHRLKHMCNIGATLRSTCVTTPSVREIIAGYVDPFSQLSVRVCRILVRLPAAFGAFFVYGANEKLMNHDSGPGYP